MFTFMPVLIARYETVGCILVARQGPRLSILCGRILRDAGFDSKALSRGVFPAESNTHDLLGSHDQHTTILLHFRLSALGMHGISRPIAIHTKHTGRHTLAECHLVMHTLGASPRENEVEFRRACRHCSYDLRCQTMRRAPPLRPF